MSPTSPTSSTGLPSVSPQAAGAAREPEDRCVRCGRPTAAGVSLCEIDNPGGIKAPSATQAHGTILAGVIVGFVLFAVAARFAVGGSGPFPATIQGSATEPDGSVRVVIRVANQGTAAAPATCRVTRDGTRRQEDVEFRTAIIQPGGSIDVERRLIAAAGTDSSYDARRVTVDCS